MAAMFAPLTVTKRMSMVARIAVARRSHYPTAHTHRTFRASARAELSPMQLVRSLLGVNPRTAYTAQQQSPLHTSSLAWRKQEPPKALASWFLPLKQGQSEESAKHVFEGLRDYVRSALETEPLASRDHLTTSSGTLSVSGPVPIYMNFAYSPELNYCDVHRLCRGGIGIRVPAEYEETVLAILKRAPAHLKAEVEEAVRDGPAVLIS